MTSVEKNTELPAVPSSGKDNQSVTAADLKESDSKVNRRNSAGPRRIPRPGAAGDVKGVKGHHNNRSRTVSESSAVSAKSQRKGGRRRRVNSEASNDSTAEPSPMRKLRDSVLEQYKKEGLNLLNSYIKNRMEFAKFDNTLNFLQRCEAMEVVPTKYRLSNNHIKNTKHVVRTLDRFSFQIMKADLKYNRKRRTQVQKLLKDKLERISEMFSEDIMKEAEKLSTEAFERRFLRIKEQQTKILDSLIKEYALSPQEIEDGEERLKKFRAFEAERETRRAAEREQRLLAQAEEQGKKKEEDGEEDEAAKDSDEE